MGARTLWRQTSRFSKALNVWVRICASRADASGASEGTKDGCIKTSGNKSGLVVCDAPF